jgi:hypothetical protein
MDYSPIIDFVALFGIPIIVALIVYLKLKAIKKAVMIGILILLGMILLGIDARELLSWSF